MPIVSFCERLAVNRLLSAAYHISCHSLAQSKFRSFIHPAIPKTTTRKPTKLIPQLLLVVPELDARLGFAVEGVGPLLVVLRFAVTTLVTVEVGGLVLADRLVVVKMTEVTLWKRAVVEVRVRVEVVVDDPSEEVEVWLV
jgi:hypothetical protein